MITCHCGAKVHEVLDLMVALKRSLSISESGVNAVIVVNFGGPRDGEQHVCICSRCKEPIEGFAPPVPGGDTAGYYVAEGWKEFCTPGEIYVCDRCMWADQRYIAVYGEFE